MITGVKNGGVYNNYTEIAFYEYEFLWTYLVVFLWLLRYLAYYKGVNESQ